MASRSLSRATRPASFGGWGGCRSERAPEPPLGAPVFSAATRYVQNSAGSLSRWSSESHATDRPSAAATVSHSASSVVLPNPAGADTRVSADSVPRLRRATRLRRHLGTWSLVSSSGPAMTTAPQEAHAIWSRDYTVRGMPAPGASGGGAGHTQQVRSVVNYRDIGAAAPG